MAIQENPKRPSMIPIGIGPAISSMEILLRSTPALTNAKEVRS
jgi:hypothetical protein